MKKQDFNRGWQFVKLDAQDQPVGEPTLVDVPHDAMIHETRTKEARGGTASAYFPGGKLPVHQDL